jgi:hypothetical protein
LPSGIQSGAARYVSAGQDAVRRLDVAAPCGWVVDLRTNGGGDMWPMLTVLALLLGDGPLGPELRWAIHGGDALLGSEVMDTNPLPLTHPSRS